MKTQYDFFLALRHLAVTQKHFFLSSNFFFKLTKTRCFNIGFFVVLWHKIQTDIKQNSLKQNAWKS
jgi:hypothetical protein